MVQKLPVIKVVGVSAGGKTTLVRPCVNMAMMRVPSARSTATRLPSGNNLTYRVCSSISTAAWKSNSSAVRDAELDDANLAVERQRLHNAYAEADLRLHTAQLSAEEVQRMALAYLCAKRIRHAPGPLPPAGETGAPVQGKIRL